MRRSILLVVCLGIAVAAPALPADEPFQFVQITDLHVGGGTDHVQRVVSAIDAINALPMPVAFVLVTGDLVRDNLWDTNAVERITRLLGRLRAPVHVVPGNHDILTDRWAETTNAYVRAFGPLQASFTCHGVVFLTLCDETLRDTRLAAAHPDCDPLGWLEQQLQAAGDQPVIVANHRPCQEDFHNNAFYPGWPKAVRQRWIDLLNRHRVRAEITGHLHRDELQWLGSVPLYVSAPLAGYYGRQGSFRIYSWSDGHLSYRTVYLD
ncbi:MAG: metallophosphoesterase [bacterium]